LLIRSRRGKEHLHSICEYENLDFDIDSCNDDSSVEITSNIDQCENELIRLSTYLHLESEDDDNHDDFDDEPFE
jgi:hypothetical protein